jgi:ssDNA-binding Zn-finger/Zn-ribbon topoisomerase 1
MSDYSEPCPRCDGRLVIRTNRENGSHFLGCTGWPACDVTKKIPETARMRALGAPELPLFEEVNDG